MAETIIGRGIVIDGEISGDDAVTIEGTVKGRIRSQGPVTVAADGVVEADFESAQVQINGQVTGNIAASDRVDLQADCRVVGDIRAPRISIADGAGFKGHIDMNIEG